MLFALLSMWKWALTPLFSHVNWISDKSYNEILGRTVTPAPNVAVTHALPIWDQSGGAVVIPTSGIVTPTLSAALPTFTPYPTYTPYPTVINIPLDMRRFSFYDPMIGKDKPEIALINCEDWNFITQYCDSGLRNGERWEDNYFKAAACPYDLYIAAAYFEVVSPDWLVALFPAGFTCKDTGEAVTGLFIDFLIPWAQMPMSYDTTPWGEPVALRRLR